MTTPSIRRATPSDAQACHDVMWISVTDLARRRGMPLFGSASEWCASGSAEASPGLIPNPLATDSVRELRAVREIELVILESARGEVEIDWLLGDRAGFLYTRGDNPVAFAFIGRYGTGPVAALDPADLPDVLLHIEGRAAGLGLQEIEFQLPGPNEVAARHLLSRGFRIDPWVNLLMSDRPFGKFDRILGFGPPLFL